jgi:hypothetical protein
MDKVLTRKLFKDVYLNTINKQVNHFKNGGLASLKVKQFSLGGLNTSGFSPEERESLILGSLATGLLEGKQAPGQSRGSALLSSLGTGGERAINTALQTKKLDIEAGSKNVPVLKPAIDSVTGKPVFLTDQQLYLDQQSGTPRYEPQAGNIEQMMRFEEGKKTAERKALAVQGMNYADNVTKITGRLVNDIQNPDTATGKLGDVTSFLGGISGGIDQIVKKDPDYDFGKLKNVLDDKSLGGLFDSVKTQEAKTTLINLAYMQAKAADPGAKISDQDLKLRLKALGESANKPQFIAGLQRSALDSIEPAIRNYQREHGLSNTELPNQYKHLLDIQGMYSNTTKAEPTSATEKVTRDTFNPNKLFKLKPGER